MKCEVLLLLLVVTLVRGTTRTVDNTCPPAILKYEDHGYLKVLDNVCYRFVTYRTMDYNGAWEECHKYGGNMAMPKTKAANDFITGNLFDHYKSRGEAWIGVNDKKNEGRFMYEDGTRVTLDFFAKDNGPNHGGLVARYEDCVAINTDRRWHDYQCKRTWMASLTRSKPEKRFICQYAKSIEDIRKEESEKEKEVPGNNDEQDQPASIDGQDQPVSIDGQDQPADIDGQDQPVSNIDQQDASVSGDVQTDGGQINVSDIDGVQDQPGSDDAQQNVSESDDVQQNVSEDDDVQQNVSVSDDAQQNVSDSDAGQNQSESDNEQDAGGDESDGQDGNTDSDCDAFTCDEDCGFSGYQRDAQGCQICLCNDSS